MFYTSSQAPDDRQLLATDKVEKILQNYSSNFLAL
jgi:hypothetical protein